ncbi:hypothetical protein BESB_005240 [Besnoitia besnoiti]|uniref:Peroxisomal membrane protein PEX14 n=1 Tax=Besnoitia besnoiti TaxID=94643 RepID=A0A2A9MPY1_BESBE|nr:hypothetical protein BESB_005240 [Besnoitia besnoiti]PFH38183.1 hypothetical protein BESB_005240 [Besnoitia besnoiti]
MSFSPRDSWPLPVMQKLNMDESTLENPVASLEAASIPTTGVPSPASLSEIPRSSPPPLALSAAVSSPVAPSSSLLPHTPAAPLAHSPSASAVSSVNPPESTYYGPAASIPPPPFSSSASFHPSVASAHAAVFTLALQSASSFPPASTAGPAASFPVSSAPAYPPPYSQPPPPAPTVSIYVNPAVPPPTQPSSFSAPAHSAPQASQTPPHSSPPSAAASSASEGLRRPSPRGQLAFRQEPDHQPRNAGSFATRGDARTERGAEAERQEVTEEDRSAPTGNAAPFSSAPHPPTSHRVEPSFPHSLPSAYAGVPQSSSDSLSSAEPRAPASASLLPSYTQMDAGSRGTENARRQPETEGWKRRTDEEDRERAHRQREKDIRIYNAVSFLTQPSVASAPHSAKRTFLLSKGLSDQEADEAFRRAQSLASSSLQPPQTSTPFTGASAPGFGREGKLSPIHAPHSAALSTFPGLATGGRALEMQRIDERNEPHKGTRGSLLFFVALAFSAGAAAASGLLPFSSPLSFFWKDSHAAGVSPAVESGQTEEEQDEDQGEGGEEAEDVKEESEALENDGDEDEEDAQSSGDDVRVLWTAKNRSREPPQRGERARKDFSPAFSSSRASYSSTSSSLSGVSSQGRPSRRRNRRTLRRGRSAVGVGTGHTSSEDSETPSPHAGSVRQRKSDRVGGPIFWSSTGSGAARSRDRSSLCAKREEELLSLFRRQTQTLDRLETLIAKVSNLVGTKLPSDSAETHAPASPRHAYPSSSAFSTWMTSASSGALRVPLEKEIVSSSPPLFESAPTRASASFAASSTAPFSLSSFPPWQQCSASRGTAAWLDEAKRERKTLRDEEAARSWWRRMGEGTREAAADAAEADNAQKAAQEEAEYGRKSSAGKASDGRYRATEIQDKNANARETGERAYLSPGARDKDSQKSDLRDDAWEAPEGRSQGAAEDEAEAWTHLDAAEADEEADDGEEEYRSSNGGTEIQGAHSEKTMNSDPEKEGKNGTPQSEGLEASPAATQDRCVSVEMKERLTEAVCELADAVTAANGNHQTSLGTLVLMLSNLASAATTELRVRYSRINTLSPRFQEVTSFLVSLGFSAQGAILAYPATADLAPVLEAQHRVSAHLNRLMRSRQRLSSTSSSAASPLPASASLSSASSSSNGASSLPSAALLSNAGMPSSSSLPSMSPPARRPSDVSSAPDATTACCAPSPGAASSSALSLAEASIPLPSESERAVAENCENVSRVLPDARQRLPGAASASPRPGVPPSSSLPASSSDADSAVQPLDSPAALRSRLDSEEANANNDEADRARQAEASEGGTRGREQRKMLETTVTTSQNEAIVGPQDGRDTHKVRDLSEATGDTQKTFGEKPRKVNGAQAFNAAIDGERITPEQQTTEKTGHLRDAKNETDETARPSE